jgi:hypothetical protein
VSCVELMYHLIALESSITIVDFGLCRPCRSELEMAWHAVMAVDNKLSYLWNTNVKIGGHAGVICNTHHAKYGNERSNVQHSNIYNGQLMTVLSNIQYPSREHTSR